MKRALAQRILPFSDVLSPGLPLGQLLRLSLFQISVGMASVMLLGTLNRVMIVELSVPAAIVAAMIALPVLLAPMRAILGFRSDSYRSAIGWKRIPYLWFGGLWQMGGLAVMPFALIVLSGDQTLGPAWAGEALAALAFLMTGLGLHMTQTAGLALAADRADEAHRPRVVALLYVMFLLGMGGSALIIGALLNDFSNLRLIRVVQGAAAVGLILSVIALWRQEQVRPMSREERETPRPSFKEAWRDFNAGGVAGRLLVVVFLGTLAFNMQDILLEPFGGEILGLSVAATTRLTAFWVTGAILGFAYAGRALMRGRSTPILAGQGIVIGLFAFPMVIFSAPMMLPVLFFIGTFGIGLGGGLFAVAMLTTAMNLPLQGHAGRGLALGAWGAAQATAGGLAILTGGLLRDGVDYLALNGALGTALQIPGIGYSFVYHLEIALLFLTLALLGPLVRHPSQPPQPNGAARIGLADFPT